MIASSINSLATVEIQLIMQGLDMRDIIQLSGCNKFFRQAAANPFALQYTSFQVYIDNICSMIQCLNHLSITNNTSPFKHVHLHIRCVAWIRLLIAKIEKMPQQVKSLLDAIQKHSKYISSLDLCGVDMAPENMTVLASIIQNSNISRASFHSCDINDSCIKILADAMKSSSTLKEVKLKANHITDVGAKLLAQAIQYNPNIKSLNVNWNNIGNEGAVSLAGAIKHNSNMTDLHLSRNNFGARGIEELATAFQNSTSMTCLDLTENCIYGAGRAALAALTKPGCLFS